jgi:hypothetical protein
MDAAEWEDLAGRLYGLLIRLENRLGGEQAELPGSGVPAAAACASAALKSTTTGYRRGTAGSCERLRPWARR